MKINELGSISITQKNYVDINSRGEAPLCTNFVKFLFKETFLE